MCISIYHEHKELHVRDLGRYFRQVLLKSENHESGSRNSMSCTVHHVTVTMVTNYNQKYADIIFVIQSLSIKFRD
jgi:hypothetical protein